MRDINTTPDPVERSRESVRRWYWNNREEYSALRRKRYRSDPKRRAKARAAAARYRKERAAGHKIQRVLTREVNGVRVPVFTTGYVSDKTKVSIPVLRGWERKGWLPESIFPEERHRLYTPRQVELVRLLADTLRAQRRTRGRVMPRDASAVLLDEVVEVIRKTWRVVDNASEDGQKARKGKG